MTNEEAINILKNTAWLGTDKKVGEVEKAIMLAADALKVQIDKDINVSNNDTISRQAAIDEIEYELEMINLALDSITLDFNARERLRQRRGEAREILNSIQQLPSAQQEPLKITIDHAPTADELERIKQAMRNTPVMLLPSTQPEIIKCRDCRKYRKLNCPFGITVVDAPDPDGYCYKAERRTDESD